MKMIFISLIFIFAGEIIRSYGGYFSNITLMMYLGSTIYGLGVAFSNVIIPVVIKKYFSKKLGFATGVYSASLAISAFLGAAISLPIANAIGWENSLAIWAIIALITIAVWGRLIGIKRLKQPLIIKKMILRSDLYKNQGVWIITLFMGTQSLMFYTIMSWLPLMVQDIGFSIEFGALSNTIVQALSIAFSLFLPRIVANSHPNNRRKIILALVALYIFGLVLLLLNIKSYTIIIIVSIVFALPIGGLFGISLLFISLVSKDVKTSLFISSFAQFGGYLLGACGPFIIGLLKDHFLNFRIGMVFCIVCCLFLYVLGYKITKIQKI